METSLRWSEWFVQPPGLYRPAPPPSILEYELGGVKQGPEKIFGRSAATLPPRVSGETPQRREALIWCRIAADHGHALTVPNQFGQVLVEVLDRGRVGREDGHLLRGSRIENLAEHRELWVGGGIMIHGLHSYGIDAPEHMVDLISDTARDVIPSIGGMLAWLAGVLTSATFGLVIGAVAALALVPVLTWVWRTVRPA